MPKLRKYHLEFLARMFSKRIIGNRYKPIENIARWCKWDKIVARYNGPKIKTLIKQLANHGLISLHGKGTVASLTQDGVIIAEDYLEELESVGFTLDDSLESSLGGIDDK